MKERVSEMGSFRDILTRQLDTLQRYFDRSTEDDDDEGEVAGSGKKKKKVGVC